MITALAFLLRLPLLVLLLLPLLSTQLLQPAAAQLHQSHYSTDEQFHEELVVRPLAGDHVNTYFQFTTRWHYGKHENRKYML